MSYFIAVDGGGTKTEFLLIDGHGNPLRRAVLGASNYQNVGATTAFETLKQGIDELLMDLEDHVVGGCLGLAGLDTDEDARVYADMVEKLFGDLAPSIRTESDCFVALHSGTWGEAGLAIIAGTGSMAYGCNEQGERARSGGWGYRFGDEGSGYYIGYQALARAVRSRDGRGPRTILAELIEERLQNHLFDIVVRYTAQDPGPDQIGSLAPLVDLAAHQGDTVAQHILIDAAEELVLAAKAVTDRLHFSMSPLRVVLAGGAFRSSLLKDRVERRLTETYPSVDCIRPEAPPVIGACVLALQQAGVPITDAVKANLKRGV